MGKSTRIGRRICRTYCDCTIIDKHRNVEDVTVVLIGEYTNDERARAAAAKKLETDRVLVNELRYSYVYASMPMEQFLREADKTEEKYYTPYYKRKHDKKEH